jgi:hypothetical protein
MPAKTPNHLEDCKVKKTLWKSGRLNEAGDELVVAFGTQLNKPGYFMAWEVKKERPECVSWNGKVNWYPRMFWEDLPNHKAKVMVLDFPEIFQETSPAQKTYYHALNDTVIEHDGEYYIKLEKHHVDPISKKPIYVPSLKSNDKDAYSSAVSYVQWFNENNRQMITHDRLLSSAKKSQT